MNKREKAIWSIAIFLASILLIIFIDYVLTGLVLSESSYSQNKKEIVDFQHSLESAVENSVPMNPVLTKLFKEYNVFADNISETVENFQTQSRLKNFMEHRKIFSKGRKPYSSINGFSLENQKVVPGQYILTIIPGNLFTTNDTLNKCTDRSNIFLKNVSFMNDNDTIPFYDYFNLDKEDSTIYNTNYYNTKLNENNDLEIYINTINEIDEYYFEVACFKCLIVGNLEEKLNELEIVLKKQKESDFVLSIDLNDPTDLSNVLILEGQDGYNQNKKWRTVQPTAFIQNETTGEKKITIFYQGTRSVLYEGDEIGGGIIKKINKDYVLFEKEQKIDTLRMSD